MTATPPAVTGMVIAGLPQALSAAACSVSSIVTSEPAKSMVPLPNCSMPALEPTPVYVTWLPEHCPAKSEAHCCSMACWKVERGPFRLPVAQPAELVDPVFVLPPLSLLPHPARLSAATAVRPIARVASETFTPLHLPVAVGQSPVDEPDARKAI